MASEFIKYVRHSCAFSRIRIRRRSPTFVKTDMEAKLPFEAIRVIPLKACSFCFDTFFRCGTLHCAHSCILATTNFRPKFPSLTENGNIGLLCASGRPGTVRGEDSAAVALGISSQAQALSGDRARRSSSSDRAKARCRDNSRSKGSQCCSTAVNASGHQA